MDKRLGLGPDSWLLILDSASLECTHPTAQPVTNIDDSKTCKVVSTVSLSVFYFYCCCSLILLCFVCQCVFDFLCLLFFVCVCVFCFVPVVLFDFGVFCLCVFVGLFLIFCFFCLFLWNCWFDFFWFVFYFSTWVFFWVFGLIFFEFFWFLFFFFWHRETWDSYR